MLLGTDIDRKQYIRRLWQASRRFRTVRVLEYVIPSNRVHLLTWVPRTGDLSEMMKWLQGAYAGDCNRRLGREGAFWLVPLGGSNYPQCVRVAHALPPTCSN
jgi:putative transposase